MSVELVRAYFKGTKYEERITIQPTLSDTVEHAAQVIGCEPQEIAKTMSFLVDDQPILIVCAGDAKISNPKYRAFFHKKAAMIKWDQVEELIGHAPGGVCPFGIKEGVKVYLDESLWRFKTVYAAAGEPNATIALSPEELFEASNALERIDVCKLPFEE